MLTGPIKSQVDQIWNTFWSGGTPNPLAVMRRSPTSSSVRRLDDVQTLEERRVRRLGKPIKRQVLPKVAWNISDAVSTPIHFRERGGAGLQYTASTRLLALSQYMRRLETPYILLASVLLASVVGISACGRGPETRHTTQPASSSVISPLHASLAAVGAPSGLGYKAYTAEVQVDGFPDTGGALLAALAPVLDSVLSRYDACSVLLRVHSPQSRPSEDVAADLGTASARGTPPDCRRSSWAWESHLHGATRPGAETVAASSEVAFGTVPLPEGSGLVRHDDMPAVWRLVYSSKLAPNDIRDFYRHEMIVRGYNEDFVGNRSLGYAGNGEYISVSWNGAGEFTIGKDKPSRP